LHDWGKINPTNIERIMKKYYELEDHKLNMLDKKDKLLKRHKNF
jgi:hypothetical protein